MKGKLIVGALSTVIILVLVSAVVLYFVNIPPPQTGNVSIGSGYIELANFTLSSGQKVTGSLTISGGSGNDINFWVTNPQGITLLNDGTVSQRTTFGFTAQSSGAYTLHFDNRFSTVSTKIVIYTLHFGLPTVFGILLMYIAIIIILLIVVAVLAVALSHKKRMSRTNRTPPPPPPSNP